MERATAAEICAFSRSLLDQQLWAPGALEVIVSTNEALTRGAWGIDADCTEIRGGGGTKVAIGEGDVYIGLALEKSNALVADCDPSRLINRHVRPLLRALSKGGVKAMYGGRDFISAKGERVGWVGMQHAAETGRAAFEAIIPTSNPALPQLISDAFLDAYQVLFPSRLSPPPTSTSTSTSTWNVERDAIGAVAVAFDSGRFRVGGDFYASHEIVGRLEHALDDAQSIDEIDSAIERVCTAPDVVIEGLKSLDALTRAARTAFAQKRP
jgi:hypothetical protein